VTKLGLRYAFTPGINAILEMDLRTGIDFRNLVWIGIDFFCSSRYEPL